MNYTYLCVLSTDNYLKGVLAVNECLKDTKTQIPFTVLVTKNISPATINTLLNHNIQVIYINESISLDKKIQKRNEDVGYKYWNYTFDSLYAFELTQFDKIVYIDCDVIVLENIDHLFERPQLTAALDPGTTDLSSGIMVIEPAKEMVEKLLNIIDEVSQKKFYFGDQNIIQAYFKDWPTQQEKHLGPEYNAYNMYLNYFIADGYNIHGKNKNVMVVHFPGPKKPWMMTLEEIEQIQYEYINNGNPYGAEMLNYYKKFIQN